MLPEEHGPPAWLNHQQQVAYCICSEYFSYESQKRAYLLRGFEQSAAPPILPIHEAPGTGKSFVVKAISDLAHELSLGDNTCAYGNPQMVTNSTLEQRFPICEFLNLPACLHMGIDIWKR